MAQSGFLRISKYLLMIETAEKVAERHFFPAVSHFAFLLTPKHADLILPVKRFLSCLLFFHLAKEQQNSCCKRHSPIAHDPPNMWKDSGKIPGQHSFFQSNGMNIGQDIS